MKRFALLLALLAPVVASAQTPTEDFSTVITILNDGSTPSGAVQLKVAKAFAYADAGDWERLVTSAGYVIETPAAGEDRDIFSVGTYADPNDTSSASLRFLLRFLTRAWQSTLLTN